MGFCHDDGYDSVGPCHYDDAVAAAATIEGDNVLSTHSNAQRIGTIKLCGAHHADFLVVTTGFIPGNQETNFFGCRGRGFVLVNRAPETVGICSG